MKSIQTASDQWGWVSKGSPNAVRPFLRPGYHDFPENSLKKTNWHTRCTLFCCAYERMMIHGLNMPMCLVVTRGYPEYMVGQAKVSPTSRIAPDHPGSNPGWSEAKSVALPRRCRDGPGRSWKVLDGPGWSGNVREHPWSGGHTTHTAWQLCQ